MVCEYEDIFSDELPGLPPYRDVDFTFELHPGTSLIFMTPYRDVDFTFELHPGTSLIFMTPHRMEPAELQELKVQL